MNDFSWIITKLYSLPAVFIGLCFHEFSHALAAYIMGDDTAKRAGRLTLSPKAHIDILGFIALLFAGFGWAKPVPINPWNFKKRKAGTIIVSLAGPLMNLFLAFLTVVIFHIVFNVMGYDNEIAYNMISSILIVNIVLCVFNLIPVPPLDGSKILAGILPERFEMKMYQLEKYSYLILLALIFSNIIDKVLDPAVTYMVFFLDNTVYNIFVLLGIF